MTLRNLSVYRIENIFLKENTYLVFDPDSGSAVAVDPGFDAHQKIANTIAMLNAKLDYIILTHEHLDHILSLQLVRRHSVCPVVSSTLCSEAIINPKRNLSYFMDGLDYIADPSEIHSSDEFWQLKWNRHDIKCYATPGHTASSICISIDNHLFSGDTIIPETRTVCNLPTSSRQNLLNSLNFIFKYFPSTTILHPGHGNNFLLGSTDISIHQVLY